MLIDGEKWACEACVRGHRVSNCQHHDRPLQHINKKGRPVSQCQHCRSMRKSRAAHVKCDCGEKTHKCMHLKTTMEGHKDSCCCNHGGRCTCSHKKEPPQLDTVPESDSEKGSKTSRARRRANTTSSEGILSFDANGHHKPTHKVNKASQKCGPYQLNRANSMHHSGSTGSHSTDDHCNDSLGSRSPTHSSVSGEMTRSEATSPLMTGSSSFTHLGGQLPPPLDLSGIKYPAYVANSAEFFGSLSDWEPPLFSAGVESAAVDWSGFEGLNFASKTGADFAPSSYSQPQSYSGGYDFAGSEQVPTLTTNTSTSGEVSEVGDSLPSVLDDFETAFPNSAAFSLPNMHANILGYPDMPLDYEEYKMKACNKFLPATTDDPTLLAAPFTTFQLEEEPLWLGDYHGLPMTASPAESNLANYWEAQ
ncbi:hypothetical protein QBC37DRAFT_57030 [Rhypophila decipiens]|uniref:Copper-fist domain-containing protein n=1 Tax=Rhypophila decipiens TaxID=261697 RepID=A0AAN6YJB1_9PEZI|nr:hypothetical protein QBC37DRAFT_57030 [Rhypophila decipiens]